MADEQDDPKKRTQAIYSEIEVKADDLKRRASEAFRNRDYSGKCFSCSKAFITRVSRDNDPRIVCTAGYPERMVPLDVVECNRFERNGELEMWDLIKMHRIIDLSNPDKVMGFKPTEGSDENAKG
jgi:hypothetical protein